MSAQEKYGYRGPAIDHSLISPSGRVSKRARESAMKREGARLFPPGFFDEPAPSAEESARTEREQKRRSAKNLRELAARGMSPRKFTREAERLEREVHHDEHHSTTSHTT